MVLTRNTRLATMVAAGALAASGVMIAAPAATAAPVFTDANTNLDGDYFAHDDGSCTESNQVESPDVTDQPVVENGPATSLSGSASVTNTGATPGDVMTGSSSISASGSVTSANGSVKSIDFNGSGQVTITSGLAQSVDCFTHTGSQVSMDAKFAVAQTGFLTVNLKKRGIYGEFYLEMVTPTNSPYFDVYSDGLVLDNNSKVFLPVGTYRVYASASAEASSDQALSRSGTVSIHAAFTAAGSQTAAQTGKGKKYVTLPGARSCSTHNLTASVTGKKKKASQIDQVKFFVNDTLVKKDKNPKKGEDYALSVADDQVAEVVAEVTLLPKHKGKPGKVKETTATYEACTG